MRTLIILTAFILNFSIYAQTNSLPEEIQIKTAVQAAPAEDRDGAMVYGYNDAGEIVLLRKGTNNKVCIADDPNFDGIQVACYSIKLEP